MPETLLLLVALLIAGAVVLLPLRRPPAAPAAVDERDAAAVRHRVALEGLRDVEADRRAGSLDDTSYAEQRAEAETHAATTASELEHAGVAQTNTPSPVTGRPAVIAAAVLGVGLVAGSLVPAAGIANATEPNCGLALGRPDGEARRDCLDRLLDELAADPEDPATLSAVADAYLAGTTADDLSRAAAALQLLIALEPERADAYERVIAAYLRAGDHANARRAHASYAAVASADPVELAFLDGLIALREGDLRVAERALDRFLELAPDDPRAEMVRALRDEAAGD